MHVRVNTVTGATDIDAGIALLRDKVVPELLGAKGFRGLTASANRATGEMGILGLWETREDLEASDSAVAKLRQEAMAVLGGSITTWVMEQVVIEMGESPPAVGNPLRIVNVSMDPARVDEHVEFFKTQILPEMKATPGFRGVRNMIDRATGKGLVGTIWADEASMQATEAGNAARQERARAQGVEVSDPTFREVLFTHLV